MRKNINALFIILCLPFFTLANTPIEVKTNVSNATVYTNSASVERKAAVAIPKGKSTIIFKGLSSYLFTNTIQFQAKGVRVLSIDYQQNNILLKDNDAYQKLMDQIKDIKEKIKEKDTYLEILNKDLELLEANKTINSNNLNIAELKSALAFFHDKRLQVEKEKSIYQKEIKTLSEEIKKLQEEANEIRKKHKTYFKDILVTVQSEKEQNIKCLLKYIVNNVGWNPTYDVLATDINSPFDVVFKANIYQNTGIDWKDINVSIASGNPSKDNTLPYLEPLYLNLVSANRNNYNMLQDKVAGVQIAPQKSRIVQEFNDDDWGASDEIEEEYIQEVEVYSGWNIESTSFQTQFTYKIPQKYTINDGTREKEISLKNEKIEALYSYRAIPKLNTDVFLVGKVTDWGKYNFIPGNANIYFENQFVGKTFLQSSQSTDTLDISLGIDESIIVKRERAYEMEKKRSFSNKKRTNRVWKLTVKNNKSSKINIEVLDQIPVSTNDQVIVTPLELSKGRLNKEDGEVKWEFYLEASKTKELILQYEVEYPSKGFEPLDIN
ncbi:mucoidy inhibitor MuiA family protein [Flammeovirga sp. EKP202]|uniref:mucoidy inhibitor MuiA family protein n=1 Tax=Flammeovirga sp. EKP202 TaxID=2770592 RepID=UPI00165F7F41|nr:mucoidy inhibitor MuiA family protein [Flammeovirga sp. EKP202]MBD0403725.1 mucoidy inhibitor MuiA family protein [Flammeovirga sp. EKP202]